MSGNGSMNAWRPTPNGKVERHAYLTPPPIIAGRIVRRIYLAGKITKHGWREDVLGFSSDNRTFDFDSDLSGELADWPHLQFQSDPSILPLIYTGPYFQGCDHGCTHHVGHAWPGENYCGPTVPAHDVHQRCLRAIEASDLVFAWIDCLDCYGTLAEIGYASRASVPILIASPTFLRDLWFTYSFAHKVAFCDEQGWTPVATSAFLGMVRDGMGQPFSTNRLETRLDSEP